jgi:cytochrome c oxidase subunit 3
MMELSMQRSMSRELARFHHSKKFALYLALASVVMLFAAFTSAYVVRKAAGNWLEFRMPDIFLVSAGVLLLSSFTAHAGLRAFLSEKAATFRWMTVLTFVLGLVFIGLQVSGWYQLKAIGVPLDGNPSGSFVYVISGAHAVHVLGGLAALFFSVRMALQPFVVTAKKKLHLEMVNIYWHFVDALWLYLVLFFILQ